MNKNPVRILAYGPIRVMEVCVTKLKSVEAALRVAHFSFTCRSPVVRSSFAASRFQVLTFCLSISFFFINLSQISLSRLLQRVRMDQHLILRIRLEHLSPFSSVSPVPRNGFAVWIFHISGLSSKFNSCCSCRYIILQIVCLFRLEALLLSECSFPKLIPPMSPPSRVLPCPTPFQFPLFVLFLYIHSIHPLPVLLSISPILLDVLIPSFIIPPPLLIPITISPVPLSPVSLSPFSLSSTVPRSLLSSLIPISLSPCVPKSRSVVRSLHKTRFWQDSLFVEYVPFDSNFSNIVFDYFIHFDCLRFSLCYQPPLKL